MNEDKIKRRRFLADLLFAGGVVSAAALLAKAAQSDPDSPTPKTDRPTGAPTPKEPALAGKPSAPVPPTSIQAKGEMALPQPRQGPSEVHLRGRVALPRPQKP